MENELKRLLSQAMASDGAKELFEAQKETRLALLDGVAKETALACGMFNKILKISKVPRRTRHQLILKFFQTISNGGNR